MKEKRGGVKRNKSTQKGKENEGKRIEEKHRRKKIIELKKAMVTSYQDDQSQ